MNLELEYGESFPWEGKPLRELADNALANSQDLLRQLDQPSDVAMLLRANRIYTRVYGSEPSVPEAWQQLHFLVNVYRDQPVSLEYVATAYEIIRQVELLYWPYTYRKAEKEAFGDVEEWQDAGFRLLQRSIWWRVAEADYTSASEVAEAIFWSVVTNLSYLSYEKWHQERKISHFDDMFIGEDGESFWEERVADQEHFPEQQGPGELTQAQEQWYKNCRVYSVGQIFSVLAQLDIRHQMAALGRFGLMADARSLAELSRITHMSDSTLNKYFIQSLQAMLYSLKGPVESMEIGTVKDFLTQAQQVYPDAVIRYTDESLVPIDSTLYSLVRLIGDKPDFFEGLRVTPRQLEVLRLALTPNKNGDYWKAADLANQLGVSRETVNQLLQSVYERATTVVLVNKRFNRRLPSHSAQLQLLRLLKEQPGLLEDTPLTRRQRAALDELQKLDEQGRVRTVEEMGGAIGVAGHTFNQLLVRVQAVIIDTLADNSVYFANGRRLPPDSLRPRLLRLARQPDLRHKLTDKELVVLDLALDMSGPSAFRHSGDGIAKIVDMPRQATHQMIRNIVEIASGEEARFIHKNGSKIGTGTIQVTLIKLRQLQGAVFLRELTNKQHELVVALTTPTPDENGRYASIDEIALERKQQSAVVRNVLHFAVKHYASGTVAEFRQKLQLLFTSPYLEEVERAAVIKLLEALEAGLPFANSSRSNRVSRQQVLAVTGITDHRWEVMREKFSL